MIYLLFHFSYFNSIFYFIINNKIRYLGIITLIIIFFLHIISQRLNDNLKSKIEAHLKDGDLVLALSAGGGGSLDEWLRQEFEALEP